MYVGLICDIKNDIMYMDSSITGKCMYPGGKGSWFDSTHVRDFLLFFIVILSYPNSYEIMYFRVDQWHSGINIELCILRCAGSSPANRVFSLFARCNTSR